MRRIVGLLCLLCTIAGTLPAIEPPTCYRISLTDKHNNPYSTDNPIDYLSPRAIQKRTKYNIAVIEEDLPVNPQYVQQILSIDSTIRLLCTSKWMNTITVYCPDSAALSAICALPCVSDVLPVANYILSTQATTAAVHSPLAEPVFTNPLRDDVIPYDYGNGYEQIAIHNGHLLHNLGFRGDNMLIAVFDAGWDGLDTSTFFSPLFQNGQLSGTRDLLPGCDNVYSGHHHGTIVTSTMAGRQEGVLVGTAPEADYFLIRSENPNTEQLIEEDFWAQAAEIADSIGADVINSSLGYTVFADFPQGNFTYANMDGATGIASLAASKLASKGIVACISAGNEGAGEWHYIGHPCDADNVLAVGAVSIYGQIAPFSSRGPSADGRVKPDIVSVGVNTSCMYPDDYLSTANGTSLAGPVAAGLCACLWQALPHKTAFELVQIVREAGSCHNNPNDSLGYGIPDFFAAFSAHCPDDVARYDSRPVEIYPNPCTDILHISNPANEILRIDFYNMTGRVIKSVLSSPDLLLEIDISDLPADVYVAKANRRNHAACYFKVVKL